MLFTMPAALLPAVAAGGSYITASAHVATQTTQRSDDDYQTLPATGALTGQAVFNGNTANFNITPLANAGAIFGASAPLTLLDWGFFHRETQADAYVQIHDEFTLDGDIQGDEPLNLSVNYSGTMMPNTAFESEYLAAYGTPTITAQITADVLFGHFADDGRFVETSHTQQNTPASRAIDRINKSIERPFTVESGLNRFGITLTIGGVGLRGGAFNMSGGTALHESGITGDGLLQAASFPDSFFEIVIETPPGLTLTSDSGGAYIRQVITPEPGCIAMLTLAIPALLRRPMSRSRHDVQLDR
jgi:hypothetical protein